MDWLLKLFNVEIRDLNSNIKKLEKELSSSRAEVRICKAAESKQNNIISRLEKEIHTLNTEYDKLIDVIENEII